MKERIIKAIGEALEKIGASEISFVVERSPDISHGDYSTNAALAAAKTLGKNPRELADELAASLINTLDKDLASHITVAGPGFMNITLSREAVVLSIKEANAKGEEWGKGDSEKGKRVMVEYADPNPFKEMHIGHLMNNTIGESISRLISNEGATIIRACYSGDVGPHVAKAIWGLRKAGITSPQTSGELSSSYVAGNTAYETSPEAKAEIDVLNQEIYKGTDHALMEEWRAGRAVALESFEKIFKVLGTHFDYYFYESETAESGLRIVRDGLNKGIFEESDGAVIYRGEKKGLHTLVFITSKSTPTYEAKDIGLAFLKEERVQTDRSIIVTAAEQTGHFKVILAALREIAPLIAEKTTHVPHGFLRLSAGKMSSREGNVITAAELIESITKKVSEKNADPLIAEQVAVGAIKYMILRQAPGSDIIFDPGKSLSLDGDSGPYLQYALVRARSVLEKARSAKHEAQDEIQEATRALERMMVYFPEVAARAARDLSPNLLVTYLTELSGEWNSFYAHERIIGSKNEAYNLLIVRAFVQTMKNGLTILGIPAPEKM